MTATSSGVVERTLPSPAAIASAETCSVPKAPNRTFVTERPIARAIIRVRKVPEAPTSMPLTISTLFSSSKPVADAARPVNALRSEITTGMSAPPIGSTKRTPKRSAPTIIRTSRKSRCGPAPTTIASAQTAPISKALPNFWPGYWIGRPEISSCSFPKATIEPANEIEPISAESRIPIAMSEWMAPGAGASLWNSASETSAAAPPPTPLNRATICGIAVIFTARAAQAPTGAKTAITIRIET